MSHNTKTVSSAMKGSFSSTVRNATTTSNRGLAAAGLSTAIKANETASQTAAGVQKNVAAAPRATHGVDRAASTTSSANKPTSARPWTFDPKTRRYYQRRGDGEMLWTKVVHPKK